MRPAWQTLVPLALAAALVACGESAQRTADVVHAASKSALETLQQAAARIDLAQLDPEVAKQKLQELIDLAGNQLAAARDSETVRRLVAELDPLIEELDQVRQSIGARIDVQLILEKVRELIERFRNDPHVQGALKALQEKLQGFTR
jgi:hypothetical protein